MCYNLIVQNGRQKYVVYCLWANKKSLQANVEGFYGPGGGTRTPIPHGIRS
jgi:hypothetical protein